MGVRADGRDQHRAQRAHRHPQEAARGDRPDTREWFLAWLAREYPRLVEAYGRLYRRGAYVDAGYRRAPGARVAPLSRRHGLTSAVAEIRSAPGPAELARAAVHVPEQLSPL